MDDERLREVYHFLRNEPGLWRTPRCVHSDAMIVLILFFGVLHQLSESQALSRRRWPVWARKLRFPSRSQFNRRARRASVQQAIGRINEAFRSELPRTQEKVCDGKPLIVGGFSKDPDAARGHVPDGFARGYKLHAIVDAGGAVENWRVTPLNTGEATVTREMVEHSPTPLHGACLRGDSSYDSVSLYTAVHHAGGRLVTPRRKPGTGLGHHPQHPDRLRAIEELERNAEAARHHRRQRIRIEQVFGRLTMSPLGLWGLPPHVRRLDRVRRWVSVKLALYHIHLTLARTPKTSTQSA
jgi:hypothetical protein